MSNLRAKISLVILALVWGVCGQVMPLAAGQMGRGLFFVCVFMSAYLAVSVVFRKEMRTMTFKAVSRGIILGVMLFALGLIQIYHPVRAGSLSLFVAVVLLAETIIHRRFSGGLEVAAAAVSIFGLLLIGPVPDMIGVLMAVIFAMYMMSAAFFVQTCKAEHLAAVQLAFATLCAVCITDKDISVHIGPMAWGVALFAGLTGGAWGFSALPGRLKTSFCQGQLSYWQYRHACFLFFMEIWYSGQASESSLY